jgi:PIN domain nuclease of toxin-antitoxin system
MNDVLVSPVSTWEMEIKRAAGKLRQTPGLLEGLAEVNFSPLPTTWEHGLAAGALPPHHRDPFDRMLVAQAQREGLTIVKRDPNISRYQASVLAA